MDVNKASEESPFGCHRKCESSPSFQLLQTIIEQQIMCCQIHEKCKQFRTKTSLSQWSKWKRHKPTIKRTTSDNDNDDTDKVFPYRLEILPRLKIGIEIHTQTHEHTYTRMRWCTSIFINVNINTHTHRRRNPMRCEAIHFESIHRQSIHKQWLVKMLNCLLMTRLSRRGLILLRLCDCDNTRKSTHAQCVKSTAQCSHFGC